MTNEESGYNRFLMSGFTPDKEIVLLLDTRREFDLESIYKQITDGFTLEDKHVAKLFTPKERAPKSIIAINYTIDATARSDHRRIWFVPTSTIYGEQEKLIAKNPANLRNVRLCDKHVWKEQQVTKLIEDRMACR